MAALRATISSANLPSNAPQVSQPIAVSGMASLEPVAQDGQMPDDEASANEAVNQAGKSSVEEQISSTRRESDDIEGRQEPMQEMDQEGGDLGSDEGGDGMADSPRKRVKVGPRFFGIILWSWLGSLFLVEIFVSQ
jgi:hypothetical protein